MTPARRHRERQALLAADPTMVASSPEGGQSTSEPERTPASAHRDRVAGALHAAAHVPAAGTPSAAGTTSSGEAMAARAIALRLTHDLRRLKEIKANTGKIEAKRQMLPDYRDWVDGVLAADKGVGAGTAADVVPTYMVWLIDTGLYAEALDILPFLLRHHVAMPSRYNRDVATFAVEEIADAAIRAQNADQPFPLDALARVDDLTDGIDMHDEVRAKLAKAMGAELLRQAETLEATPESRRTIEDAITSLKLAQMLNERAGVRDRIKRADKLLAAHAAAFPPAPEPFETETSDSGGDSAA